MGPFRFWVNALAGFVVPVRVSGRAYFRQCLKNFGVNTSALPTACLNELADQATHTAKIVSGFTRHGFRETVVNLVEGQAANVAEILKTREHRSSQDDIIPDFRDRVVPILERHGVHVPPL
jgi:hypothetical protein